MNKADELKLVARSLREAILARRQSIPHNVFRHGQPKLPSDDDPPPHLRDWDALGLLKEHAVVCGRILDARCAAPAALFWRTLGPVSDMGATLPNFLEVAFATERLATQLVATQPPKPPKKRGPGQKRLRKALEAQAMQARGIGASGIADSMELSRTEVYNLLRIAARFTTSESPARSPGRQMTASLIEPDGATEPDELTRSFARQRAN